MMLVIKEVEFIVDSGISLSEFGNDIKVGARTNIHSENWRVKKIKVIVNDVLVFVKKQNGAEKVYDYHGLPYKLIYGCDDDEVFVSEKFEEREKETILALKKQGWTPEEIAKVVKRSTFEVELALDEKPAIKI
jgi:hypothetical protein